MIQIRRRKRVRLGHSRRNEEFVGVVIEQCGEWHELDLSAWTPIGSTQDGDGFAGVAMSAVHEREIVTQCRSPERVKVGAMAGKQ
jgi:hypothetical protein